MACGSHPGVKDGDALGQYKGDVSHSVFCTEAEALVFLGLALNV